MLEPNGTAQVSLRRFHSPPYKAGAGWTCAEGHHDASTQIGKCREWKDYKPVDGDNRDWVYVNDAPKVSHEDSRWPKNCKCGYVFIEADYWQVFTDRIYLGPDGVEYSLRKPPIGALWYAE